MSSIFRRLAGSSDRRWKGRGGDRARNGYDSSWMWLAAWRLVAGYGFQPLSWLVPQGLLEGGQLRFDINFQAAALDDVLTIPAQEIVDGLHPDTNRPRRLILIQVLE